MKILSMMPRIQSDYDGYNTLIKLYHEIISQETNKISIDFSETTVFEANLSAVLGAICGSVAEREIQLDNISPILDNELCRNHFLAEHGREKLPDIKGQIITYRKFTPYQDIEFIDYISTELLSKPDFPKHSEKLGKRINVSIFELFENARTHGHCKHIFTCGQNYPNSPNNRLDITIVDMGKTIKSNVNQYLKIQHEAKSIQQYIELSSCEAITWAMEYGNTTKTDNVSGGLGLGIIFEFIQLNNGKIQIVSSDGYWEFYNGNITTRSFDNSFPGTIVNIEFNLDDTNSYQLKEEISLDDIF